MKAISEKRNFNNKTVTFIEVVSPNEKNKIQRHHQQVRFVSRVPLDNQFIPGKMA